MSFIGFSTRRALKASAYYFIDKYVTDPKEAKEYKEAVNALLLRVGITLSVMTLDIAGIIDAIRDGVSDVAEAVADQAVEGTAHTVTAQGSTDVAQSTAESPQGAGSKGGVQFGGYGTTHSGEEITKVDAQGNGYTGGPSNYISGTDPHTKSPTDGQWHPNP